MTNYFASLYSFKKKGKQPIRGVGNDSGEKIRLQENIEIRVSYCVICNVRNFSNNVAK